MADKMLSVGLETSQYENGEKVVRRVNENIEASANRAALAVGRLESQMTRAGVSSTSGFGLAKNAIEELNKPLATVHSMSQQVAERFIRIGLTVLAFRAVGDTIGFITGQMRDSIKAVDDFNVKTIQIAASLTQIAANRGVTNLSEEYRKSAKYAEALAVKLMEVDKNSFANYEGLMAMLQVMTAQGIVLDINNKKQVESFTNISNAIATYTAGQNQSMQSFQEMRALLSGQVNMHSQVARIVDIQIKQQGIYKGGLKEVVALGRQNGRFLEMIGDYMKGINAASGDIKTTWTAIKTSFETAIGVVQRASFKDIVKDLSSIVGSLGDVLRDNVSIISEGINGAWKKVRDTIFDVSKVTDEMGIVTTKFTVKPEVLATLKSAGDLIKTLGAIVVNTTSWMIAHSEVIKNVTIGLVGLIGASKVSAIAQRLFTESNISGVAAQEAAFIADKRREAGLRSLGITESSAVLAERAAAAATQESYMAAGARMTQIAEEIALLKAKMKASMDAAISEKAAALASRDAAAAAFAAAKSEQAKMPRAIGFAKKSVAAAEEALMDAKANQIAATSFIEKEAAIRAVDAAQKQLTSSTAALTALRAQWQTQANGIIAAETELAAATTRLAAAEYGLVASGGAAEAAAIRYNAALVKQGITDGFVTKEMLINLQLKRTAQIASMNDNFKLMYMTRLHTEALIMHEARTIAATGAVTGYSWAARAAAYASNAAAGAITLMGKAFNAIGGWVTVVTALVMAGVWAWDKWGNAAEKAKEKALKGQTDNKEYIERLKEQAEQEKILAEVRRKQEVNANIEDPKKKIPLTPDEIFAAKAGSDYGKYREIEAQEKASQIELGKLKNTLDIKGKLTKEEQQLRAAELINYETYGKQKAEMRAVIEKREMPTAPEQGKFKPDDKEARKEAERALHSLMKADDEWRQSAIKSGKVDDELGSKLEALKDKYITLMENTKKASGREADLAREGIKESYNVLKQNLIAEDKKKGQEVLDRAIKESAISTQRDAISTGKSLLKESLADNLISHKQYYDDYEKLVRKETANEIKIIREQLDDAMNRRDTATSDGAMLKAQADVVRLNNEIRSMEDKGAKAIADNSRERLGYLDKVFLKEQEIALKKQELAAKESAFTASRVGVDSAGNVVDEYANQNAIKDDYFSSKMEHLQMEFDQQTSLMIKHREDETLREEALQKQKELMLEMYLLEENHKTGKANIWQKQQVDGYNMVFAQAKKVYPQLEKFDDTYQRGRTIALKDYSKIEAMTSETGKELVSKETRSKMTMVSDYTGLAGSLFQGLADTQDQTSRSGFEKAKAFNLAAAIMQTASGVTMALATLPPPASYVAAAATAAMGLIQIVKIASTSFGGGGSGAGVSAPTGSIAAGGSSGKLSSSGLGSATRGTYIDNATAATLDRIAASLDNTSLIMYKAASALERISNTFSDESKTNPVGYSPGLYGQYGSPKYGSNDAPRVAGAAVGAAAGIKGGVVAGVYIGSMFGPVGTVIGAIAGAIIGGIVGGVAGYLATSGVLRGPKKVTSSGIDLKYASGEIGGDYYEKWKQKGGWFHSDKSGYNNYAMSKEDKFLVELNKVQSNISDANRRNFVALGLGGSAYDTAARNTKVDIARIQTSGRKPEDISKDLEAMFLKISNSIIETGIKDIQRYAISAEETATGILDRLAGSLVTVNAAFDLLGKNLIIVSLDGGDAAYSLITAFGDVEKFGESLDNYFTTIFSDSEQLAMKYNNALGQISTTLAIQGVTTVPTTAKEFKNLVNSLDVTTASGAMTFKALMDLVPAMESVIKYTDKVKETQQDWAVRMKRVSGDTLGADLLELQIDQQKEWQEAIDLGLDTGQLRILQEKEWANTVDEALGLVKESSADLLETTKQNAINMVDAYEGVVKKLIDVISGPSAMLSPEDQYNMTKQNYLDIAGKDRNSLTLEEVKKIPDLAQEFLDASKAYNASGAAYWTDFQSVTDYMKEFANVPPGEDPSITLLNAQITKLEEIKDAINKGDAASLTGKLEGVLGDNSTLVQMIGAWSDEIARTRLEAMQTKAQGTMEQDKTIYDDLKADYDTAVKTLFTGQTTYNNAVNTYFNNTKPAKTELDTANALYAPMYAEWVRINNTQGHDAAQDYHHTDTFEAAEARYVAALADWKKVSTSESNILTQAQTIWNGLSNTQSAIISSLGPKVNAAYEVYLASKAAYDKLMATEIESSLSTVLSGNPGASFAIGSANIPNDMIAQVHQGEIIIDRYSSDVLRKYGIPTKGSADNRGVEERLDRVVQKLEDVVKQLNSIETKARLVANA